MNLVGKNVKHKTLGTGIVTAHCDNIITVDFPLKTSKFEYTQVTFTKFLIAEDPSLQAAIIGEFEATKAAIEAAKLAEEAAKLKAAEEMAALEAAKRTPARPASTRTKKASKEERIPGKRMTFYVFQGSTFDRESRGGYIWAPISNKAGNTFHHWDRLLDVHPGDIILHGYNAHVQAVSIARDYCFECNQPEELRSEDLWDQEGRRVNCEYIVFKSPVKTSQFTDDIFRLCSSVKYAPFDKDGNGNMGYLYSLNRELAQIFLRAAVSRNPNLKDVDYIRELLSEGEIG